MTKRAHEEPYTFAPSETGIAETVRGVRMLEMKSSVAAHQEECLCHPVVLGHPGCCQAPEVFGDADPGRGSVLVAHDSSGQEWHLDPQCKVRPEARA